MKLYQKIAGLTIIVCILFSLSSCRIWINQTNNIEDDITKIASVDIYDTNDYVYTDSYDGSILEIREHLSPIHTIADDDVAGFLNQLEELEYKRLVLLVPAAVDYAHIFSDGYIVVIEYVNGGCDIYAEKGIYVHTVNDEGSIGYNYYPAEYRGETPWNDFIEKYIQ